MIKKLMRQPQFIIGALFIASLLIGSFLYTFAVKDTLPDFEMIKFDENGDVASHAPYSPSDMPPLGSDKKGTPLLYKIIDGAKYTILIAFSIAFLRILFSIFISYFYNRYLKRLHIFLDGIMNSMLYIPTSILCYMLMIPLFVNQNSVTGYTTWEALFIQSFILLIIGMPPLISLISKEMLQEYKRDYIVSSYALGAKDLYLHTKHILPKLLPRFSLMFSQQVVQILILLTHLGALEIFLGGSKVMMSDVSNNISNSIVNEWSGIIGHSFSMIMVYPWIIVAPLTFFSLTILSMNLITIAIQKVTK